MEKKVMYNAFVLAVMLAIALWIFHLQKADSYKARKFISDCKAAGGEPVYDLCAEKGFRVILLEGYEWAPEVYDYNK